MLLVIQQGMVTRRCDFSIRFSVGDLGKAVGV